MALSSAVSAKVPKKLKDQLEKAGVNISEAIRNGLETALQEKRVEQLQELLNGVDLSKLTNEQIVRDIRNSRETRTAIKIPKRKKRKTVAQIGKRVLEKNSG